MTKKEQKYVIKGADGMLEWIESLPIKGGARRSFELHLTKLKWDWEAIKKTLITNK